MENKKIYEKDVLYTVNDGSMKLYIYEKKMNGINAKSILNFYQKMQLNLKN